ncbi:MAG TPA: hypothetical protein PLB71_08690 [Methanoculleus sp.]|uniref:hypothetical protein n=1 Tax=Methanoculleus sp. TaxID=90427 RepID=UPI001B3D10F5|nr:hypothetical protein [Methanoculleus sp.]MBP7144920.1 hypothetical protein [Methanoculleus sp.]HNT07759.1 hypothetical protein [Methanoculleus sp.]HOC84440.1 hypothetical protein [Methanoculleus sp.]HPK80302.1 hypothetical protein [Methanoculleus sp.]HQL59989.1 hypothetical protein [Methanoculleus sp.]
MLFVLPALLLVAIASAAGVADPAGDFLDPDITALSCYIREGILYVRTDLAREPVGSYGGCDLCRRRP